ncbi:BRAC1 domain containing protein [Entamoeba histolytica HM-1:IMSS-B]|uniref:BRCT domain-containing protein n=4 Tax=Entamoeba histolytica TaxID=5759 RepID=C4M6L7_ENTH1|nr:hypothetical protein EHI_147580 [Entamoeba histolytica HM-1:IMSS]EAL49135.1 hypothetical protein EHI_147580 [Entamoeba histolytica HM-1:IMSS]EMH76512.1 BRAC1 domain containing protein [Entamoeba histolytica HM-1:IMSS-B]ENY65877.1 BRCA1 C Terminus (BRCT) domain containing protein [Entamoeba histolytica HM-1:IMSS-A]GAT97148.1 brac1 domain containing protein [Entamoeba histolytica]|eukprot:XP_654521.1 hypothetical protein EHI_147580 [Entamoeba histolytica HM-1:IMSS]
MAEDEWQETTLNPKKRVSVDIADINDKRTNIFSDKTFKLLGFSTEQREPIRAIIEDNGGEISNKKDVDFAIMSEEFKGASKKTYEERGCARSLKWLCQCIYYNELIIPDEEGKSTKRNSSDILLPTPSPKRTIDLFPDESLIKPPNDESSGNTLLEDGGDTRDSSFEDTSVLQVNDHIIKSLPNIFSSITIYFGRDIDQQNRTELQRYFIAYGGNVSFSFNSKVTHYITNNSTDKDIVHLISPQCEIVSPQWLFLSINSKTIQPLNIIN